jgi:hypothetical protein
MYNRLIAASPRELGKWCAYALIMLAPGSFVVLPVLWLVRLRTAAKSAAGVIT